VGVYDDPGKGERNDRQQGKDADFHGAGKNPKKAGKRPEQGILRIFGEFVTCAVPAGLIIFSARSFCQRSA
jgi:hypothetical protein